MQFAFEQPINLWFLLSIPLLALAHFFFLRHAKRNALRFSNFRALKRITGRNLVTRNCTLLALRLGVLVCVILAVSGTVVWRSGLSNANDYVLAVDTSSSMTSQDVPPTRMDAAKADAKLFVDSLDSETRIGVITFAGVSLIETVPTDDKQKVQDVLDGLAPLKAGGTDIPGAIITSTNLLLDNSKGRSIILLTDGSNTIETFLDASMQRALDYAQEHRVTIDTIGIGTNNGPIGYLETYYNVSATYNEDNLVRIANATGGVYAHTETKDELLDAFQAIADHSSKQLLRTDLLAPLMLIALLLLFVEWLLVNTRFRIIP